MGKKPQNGKSKTKSAPTWREKLKEFNINKIYDGRTCEIILMAELTISYTEAVALFHNGAKDHPTNVVKSINFEQFLNEIKQGQSKRKAEKSKVKTKGDPTVALFQAAVGEALQFLNIPQSVPVELWAQLLKLKIINMINEDVTLRDEERLLEIEKINLANNAEATNKKGGKEKDKKKGKKKTVIKLPLEERKLYFIINGFYNPSLIEELFNIGIKLTAILELASPECVAFREKHGKNMSSPLTSSPALQTSLTSNNTTSEDGEEDEVVLFINQFYCGSKESVCYSVFAGEQSMSSITSSIYEKISELNNFWNQIFQELEGELQARFLESAAHMRVNPISSTRVDKNPQEIFLEIAQNILIISDLKRQHVNYLNHVKVCEINLEPKNKPAKFWKTYKELMDVVPSDCFTIGLFLHCLVEEVCLRVPDPKVCRKGKSKSKESNPKKKKNSIIPEQQKKVSEPEILLDQTPDDDDDNNSKALKELANYVIQYRKSYAPLGKCAIKYHKNKRDQKINLKIRKEPFIIHETSGLEYKLNTYQELAKKLLALNINTLSKNPVALLWNLYPQLETIEVIYKNHQLETWRRMLNLTQDEIQSALSAIQFDLLECTTPGIKINQCKNNLHLIFPGKNESTILKAATPNIKYIQTPDISLTTLNERESYLRIPDIPYLNIPNIYEAKNIQTYLWYEKLPQKIMVQQLQKANSEYICVDHKYCPYNDSIMLRFHNNLDMFGINSTIWTQSLKTPICFRDFCKYILHEESQWLEREEDNYQEKLKTNRRESLKCAKTGKSFNFFAYNLGEARIQLTGATTIFYSMDGYKITVDRTNFIGKPTNISVNVSIAGHNFILHHNKATDKKDSFTFHFSLSDGTILVFSKPTSLKVPEISIAEKNRISKTKSKNHHPKSVYRPREKKYYYVSEIKRWYIKNINVPTVVKNNTVLEKGFMSQFLHHIKQVFPAPRKYIKMRSLLNPDRESYISIANGSEDSKKVVTLFKAPTIQEKELAMSKSQAEINAVLQKIQEAKKVQIPMFKVYSSKLHKYEFIKRIKSYIHIKVGKHILSLPCKHPTYKTTRNVEVVKVFPLKLTDTIFSNKNCYDIKISLPSGLLLYTLPGINDKPFNIRQKYIEKTPHCKNVINEDSRSFMRNGHVVIKKNDGTLDILSVNGEIIHCEIPHSTVQKHTKYKLKNQQQETNNNLFRIVNWRRRHIIKGSEARYFKHRRINLRQYKLEAKKNKQIYVMKKEFEYTLITHDGKQLKVTNNSNVKKEKQFFQTTHSYQCYDDEVNLRDDGTINVINDGGIYTTQFKDKTKITSWFAEAPELVLLEEEDEYLLAMDSMSSFFYEQIINDGWVLVQMFYKYEHPNYATILYSEDNYETEIILPNNVVINVTENGHYFMDVDRIFSSVINDELVYLESKSCETCMQRNITVFNIQPLYEGINPIEENTELLKTCDSYEKIFLVNYNGKCFRNSNYVKYRTNRAECPHHDKEDYQQLFVLNRDLSGSKFWDIKAYRKRITEATDNNNTVLQYYGKNTIGGDYTSLEIRTYKYKPYHTRFINQHLINELIYKGFENQPKEHPLAYTTLCHIYSMPKECMKKLLEAFMMEHNNNNNKGGEFPKPDNKDTLCRCVSQIGRENIKLKGKSVFDEHLRKISSALLLLKKWYTWHEFHKPYVPLTEDQICKCNKKYEPPQHQENNNNKRFSEESFGEEEKQYNSLEILPERRRVDSNLIIPPLKHIICECKKPSNFVCECKPTTQISVEDKKVISSTNDFYACAEETVSASDVAEESVSETIIKSCKCNDKKLNQRPLAPKHRVRKTCTDKTCEKQQQKRSITSITNKDNSCSNTTLIINNNNNNTNLFKRQAGGADNDSPLFSSSYYVKTLPNNNITEKKFILKQIQKRVMEVVLVSASNKITVEEKKAERYKVAVAIDIISNIFRAKLNYLELTNFLQKLNELDINKCKKLPTEQLSNLILSLSKNKINNKNKLRRQQQKNDFKLCTSSTVNTTQQQQQPKASTKKCKKVTKK